jgi:hypothetical protein
MKDEATGPGTDDSSIDAIWAAFAEPLRRFIRRRADDADDDSQIIRQDPRGLGGLATPTPAGGSFRSPAP